MRYKILGFAVWHGAKWYMKRRLGVLGSRKALAAGAVGAGVAVLVLRGSRATQHS
jgi:hypothetical protein